MLILLQKCFLSRTTASFPFFLIRIHRPLGLAYEIGRRNARGAGPTRKGTCLVKRINDGKRYRQKLRSLKIAQEKERAWRRVFFFLTVTSSPFESRDDQEGAVSFHSISRSSTCSPTTHHPFHPTSPDVRASVSLSHRFRTLLLTCSYTFFFSLSSSRVCSFFFLPLLNPLTHTYT